MDISDLYSTRIQKSFDEDQAEILSILQANPSAKLKLINYYKGIPLSYPATIASVNRGIVDLDVQDVQAFSIEHARSTFIRSPLFKHDLFAQAQYVNVRKKAATFVKFCYVEIMAERRNFVRVELDSLCPVRLETQHGLIDAQITDISLNGISLKIDHTCPLDPGAEVAAAFTLSNPETGSPLPVKLPAVMVAVSGDVPPYEYRFSINPEKQLERQLSQYIFQRQVAIIREVKDAVL